jgi:uncharacterized protein
MTIATQFAPFSEMAEILLPLLPESGDGSHDLSHVARVFKTAMQLQASEGGDAEIIATAVMLHDCVHVEKSSPLRSKGSALSAQKATEILLGLGWGETRTAKVAHAVEAHSFSANIEPTTVEAKIVQDADRLDAIGMVGIARCFYTSGRMGSRMYEPNDPKAETRDLDDRNFAIDHFPAKLLGLSQGMKTKAGQALADVRHKSLLAFYEAFLNEV